MVCGSHSHFVAVDSGWITNTSFFAFIRWFVEVTGAGVNGKVVALMVDNHKSRFSEEMWIYAAEHGVLLFALPSNSTGKLQPVDVGPGREFRAALNEIHDNESVNFTAKPLGRDDIVGRVLHPAWDRGFSRKAILDGWKNSGFFPLNRAAVRIEELVPQVVDVAAITQTLPISEHLKEIVILPTAKEVEEFHARLARRKKGGRKPKLQPRARLLTDVGEKAIAKELREAREKKVADDAKAAEAKERKKQEAAEKKAEKEAKKAERQKQREEKKREKEQKQRDKEEQKRQREEKKREREEKKQKRLAERESKQKRRGLAKSKAKAPKRGPAVRLRSRLIVSDAESDSDEAEREGNADSKMELDFESGSESEWHESDGEGNDDSSGSGSETEAESEPAAAADSKAQPADSGADQGVAPASSRKRPADADDNAPAKRGRWQDGTYRKLTYGSLVKGAGLCVRHHALIFAR